MKDHAYLSSTEQYIRGQRVTAPTQGINARAWFFKRLGADPDAAIGSTKDIKVRVDAMAELDDGSSMRPALRLVA